MNGLRLFNVVLLLALPCWLKRLKTSATEYDNWTESTFGSLNRDFGRVITYQTPRQIRFRARFEF